MIRSNLAILVMLAAAASMPAKAESVAPSRVSELSTQPSEASAAVVIEVLPAGAHLVVTALRPLGDLVEISAQAAGHASITGLRVSAVTARKAGLAVGDTLAVSAVSAGWMISSAGEAIAFVPDRLAHTLTHSRGL